MATDISPYVDLTADNDDSPMATYDDLVRSSDLFWENLRALLGFSHSTLKAPIMAGQSLDLHRLFIEVTSRGGMEKVIQDRKWKEVIGAFNFPKRVTSGSFVLKKYYLKYLYQLEHAFYVQNQVPSVQSTGGATRSLANVSQNPKEGEAIRSLANVSPNPEEGEAMLSLAIVSPNPEEGETVRSLVNVSPNLEEGTEERQNGCAVQGFIDGKFDGGYLVTAIMGSEELRGVLYHIPQPPSQPQQNLETSPAIVPPSSQHRQKKRPRLAQVDPQKPKGHRSGYNFFYAEHYPRLKPWYENQDLTKLIGQMWINRTDAEKQYYQEKGLKDLERYRTEMLEYKSALESGDASTSDSATVAHQ